MTDARIYTRLGDDGSTGLLFGGRVSKADIRIDVVGSIDEAVATLGLARALDLDAHLAGIVLRIQRDLFVVGADLVTQPQARNQLVPGISLVTPEMVVRIEQHIDQLIADAPLQPVFVVPGANGASAALDMARAQIRTAERRVVAMRFDPQLAVDVDVRVNPHVPTYLNRTSDLLYVLARRAAGDTEEPMSHDAIPPAVQR